MMKKSFYTLLLLIIICLVSCKKNNTDKTPPVITLIGSSEVIVETGTSYTDAGATALDDTDGDITSRIVVYNPVDVNIDNSTYYVTYNVSDNAGNVATEVKRKVKVMHQ